VVSLALTAAFVWAVRKSKTDAPMVA